MLYRLFVTFESILLIPQGNSFLYIKRVALFCRWVLLICFVRHDRSQVFSNVKRSWRLRKKSDGTELTASDPQIDVCVHSEVD